MLRTLIWIQDLTESALEATEELLSLDEEITREVAEMLGLKRSDFSNVIKVINRGIQNPEAQKLDLSLLEEVSNLGLDVFYAFGLETFLAPEKIESAVRNLSLAHEALCETGKVSESIRSLLAKTEKSLISLRENFCGYGEGLSVLIRKAKRKVQSSEPGFRASSSSWKDRIAFLFLCREEEKRFLDCLSDQIKCPAMKGFSALLLMSPLKGVRVLSPEIVDISDTSPNVAVRLSEALGRLRRVEKKVSSLIGKKEKEALSLARPSRSLRLP